MRTSHDTEDTILFLLTPTEVEAIISALGDNYVRTPAYIDDLSNYLQSELETHGETS